MKSFIKPMTLAAVLGTGCAMASDSDVDARLRQMEQLIEQQQQQLQAQQQEMNEMRGAMAGQQYLTHDEAQRLIQNEMTVMVDERVEQGMAQMRDSSPILTLGNNIDGLDIRGDLRIRYERIEMETTGSESTQDRWRVRLRLGGVWKSEGWEIGLGLATGSTSGSSATSTNQDYSDDGVFKTNNFNLDYAYAKHTWGDLSVTAGQFKNPFETSWILWDSDVRPVGAIVQYDYQGFFLTVGGFDSLDTGANQALGYLVAAQLGYEGSYDQLDFLIATSYYHFNKATVDNTVVTTNGFDPSDYDFAFEIWDVYGELTYTMNDVKIGLHAHVLKNFGADDTPDNMSSQLTSASIPSDYNVDDNDMAWLVGGWVSYMGVKLGYDYAHIEGDAVLNDINDGDFGNATGNASVDVKGHKLTAKYTVNKNLSFQATAFFVTPIERTEMYADNSQLYQFDAVWKF